MPLDLGSRIFVAGHGGHGGHGGLVGSALMRTLEAEILFDRSKPDGTPRKQLDVTRLHGPGWNHRIDQPDGIATTYSWFMANQPAGVVPRTA